MFDGTLRPGAGHTKSEAFYDVSNRNGYGSLPDIRYSIHVSA